MTSIPTQTPKARATLELFIPNGAQSGDILAFRVQHGTDVPMYVMARAE
jgi:hypothetical protein